MKKILDWIYKNPDKPLHTLISTIIVIIYFIIFSNILKYDTLHSIVFSCVLTYFSGVIKEIYDKYYRFGWNIKDINANLIGIVIGAILLILIKL